MKKAAWAIPLIALLIGAFLFWWHSSESRTVRREPGSAGKTQPPRPAPGPSPTSPSGTEEAPPTASGSLRIVVTSGGTPLAGAKVIVQRDGVDEHRRFETPQNGSQTIQGMPPATYVVGAGHPKHLPAEGRAQVLAGQTAELRIELRRGGRLFGRITDAGGHPLLKANVLLTKADTRAALGPGMGAWTDEQGVYEMPAIPAGEWGIRILHNRFKTAERYPFSFLQGTETYEVNVALEVGARVTGRVLDEQGAAIEGANVMIGNHGSGGVTKSDKNGEFGMYGLTDDPVNASVSAKGHGTVIKRGIRPNTDGLEFHLPRPGTIVGRVEGTEIPEHFVVILSRWEEDLKQILRVDTRYFTNPAGGIFVVEDVSPARYWVEVQAQGFESTDKPEVTIEAGKVGPELRMRFTKK